MSDEVPCAAVFATETMAELSARQGRLADAAAIYRHLLRGADAEPDGSGGDDLARLAQLDRWRVRLAALEKGGGARQPEAPPRAPAQAEASPRPSAPAEPRATLVVREPVRSGQVVYAEGRDLIVIGPVHPGAQLLADGNIHIYGLLKGRAVAGAHGARDAQVFCLALEAELVGVDAGYIMSEDLPPEIWGGPARVFLTADGVCAAIPMTAGRRGVTR